MRRIVIVLVYMVILGFIKNLIFFKKGGNYYFLLCVPEFERYGTMKARGGYCVDDGYK
jgi:hypothetical protein